MERIEPLDWLRGFMAVTIVIYHYLSWGVGIYDSGTVFGRLGIYAVSTFFIISGLSLAIAYNSKVETADDIYNFIVKRFLRILPLLWVATTYEIIRSGFSVFPVPKILMNYLGVFGFINPSAYIITGGWAIGNEIVFYTLFPIFIFAYNKSIRIGNLITYLTILLEIFMIRYYLSGANTLERYGVNILIR